MGLVVAVFDDEVATDGNLDGSAQTGLLASQFDGAAGSTPFLLGKYMQK